MKGFNVVNLLDAVNEAGEDKVMNTLACFSSHNKDVEAFLKERALVFAKQSISQTHLVFASYKQKPAFIGYFTLANKEFIYKINGKYKLSNNICKRLKNFGQADTFCHSIKVNAPLIGQIGKNYFVKEYTELITGDELLKIACDKIMEAQRILGGKIVYLECENLNRLVNFYSDNGFVIFGERKLDKSEEALFEGKTLLQMLRVLK